MKLRDPKVWEAGLKNNQDGYGACCYRYAQRWAEMMEERINNGEALSDIAETTSHEADTEGITGFMYGCAAQLLAAVWEHGEELRRWHNLKTQIGTEGEQANDRGTILNPAILNIRA